MRPSREGEMRSELALPHGGGIEFGLVDAGLGDGPGLLEEIGAAGVYVLGDGTRDPVNGFASGGSAWGWTEGQRGILVRGLELDMPVLAVGDGFLLLNEAFGGKLPEVSSTGTGNDGVTGKAARRTVYVSPGSKTAAILGAGGFFRLEGVGPLPRLTERERAPRLLASAYDVEDGAVEGLESAEHDWVIGFRADLSSGKGLPRGFGGIFQGFVERAEEFWAGRESPSP